MIVKCDFCREEYDAQPFFYGHSIATCHNPNTIMDNDYTVYVRGKSICPRCGRTVEIDYRKRITYSDMVAIATKGEE